MIVASEDSSYMPARIVVLGGDDPTNINTELNTVCLDRSLSFVLTDTFVGCDSSSGSFVVAGQRASVSQSYCAAGEHDSLLVHRADQGQEVSAGKPHSFKYQKSAH